MRILVFMSDNRKLNKDPETTQYHSLVAYINKAYCNVHGYDFLYIRPYYKYPEENNLYVCRDRIGNLRHVSWAKLLVAQHCNTLGYDYIVYIDSDCIFKNFNISLESIINDTAHHGVNIIYASNLPWHKLPCAGFFIVKVNDETKRFIENWYNYTLPVYDSVKWKNTIQMSNKYCSYNWVPDKHWEQDALWCMIANNEMIPYSYINENTFEENTTQFLRHICHVFSNQRQPYFQKIVDTLLPKHGSFESIIETIHTIELDTSTM
jgi:hypothetical protein